MDDRLCCGAIEQQAGGPMAIGEFGGAPASLSGGGLVLSSPMYWLWELSHAALNPARAVADATRLYYKNPINPFSATTFGKSMAAAAELFERSTRRYGRPEWEIRDTTVGGEHVPVHVSTVWERPFCRLLRFERSIGHMPHRPQPRLLIVAPMSGHYATLLRGRSRHSCPTTTSTSPTGSTPAWCRS